MTRSLHAKPAAPPRDKAARTSRVVLERRQRFSHSLLWHWQRRYFASRGIAAWSENEVPHYVTSNVTLAQAYAEIVFACWRDGQREAATAGRPLTILELGAGCGRLAFHFLTHLRALGERDGTPLASIRYVLSDQSNANFGFWRTHPRLQPFFAEGLLDMAVCDLEAVGPIRLEVSGATLAPGELARPLVVIANYVFDSIPQDLYHLDGGRCSPCRVSLTLPGPPTTDPAELLRRVEVDFSDQPAGKPEHAEPWLQALLEDYARALDRTYLLFPTVALRGLDRLSRFSPRGLLLLSADKGDHRLTELEDKPPPAVIRHGSISLKVNYHAIKTLCERRGGRAFFPPHCHYSLNVSCCLMLEGAAHLVETQRAYQRHVTEFGPDDFYGVMLHARRHLAEMTVRDILAYLRLSRHDAHQFGRYLPRLRQLAPTLEARDRDAVREAIARVRDRYFPIGETLDLEGGIAALLSDLGEEQGPVPNLPQSIEPSGGDTDASLPSGPPGLQGHRLGGPDFFAAGTRAARLTARQGHSLGRLSGSIARSA